MVANIFALFFTTQSDPWPIRWCKEILQKVLCFYRLIAHARYRHRSTEMRCQQGSVHYMMLAKKRAEPPQLETVVDVSSCLNAPLERIEDKGNLDSFQSWVNYGMHPLFRHPLFRHPLFRHLCLLCILAKYTHYNISFINRALISYSDTNYSDTSEWIC